jgi:aryl-alcohol dehydrogenase-like predicted oxidoreductase
MKMRKLGHQGLVVSELGLGCMGMSEFYGDSNEQEAFAPWAAPFGASPRFIMLLTSV